MGDDSINIGNRVYVSRNEISDKDSETQILRELNERLIRERDALGAENENLSERIEKPENASHEFESRYVLAYGWVVHLERRLEQAKRIILAAAYTEDGIDGFDAEDFLILLEHTLSQIARFREEQRAKK